MINNKYNLNDRVCTFSLDSNGFGIKLITLDIKNIIILGNPDKPSINYSASQNDKLYNEKYCFISYTDLIVFLSKFTRFQDIK